MSQIGNERLASSPAIARIAGIFGSATPRLDVIVRRWNKTRDPSRFENDAHAYTLGFGAELFVATTLEALADQDDAIGLNPIPFGRSQGYTFQPKGMGYEILQGRDPVTDIDYLFTVDNVPVIVEVKAGTIGNPKLNPVAFAAVKTALEAQSCGYILVAPHVDRRLTEGISASGGFCVEFRDHDKYLKAIARYIMKQVSRP